ncbi:hypothetical protein CPB84DRAFT_1852837 [Gymnopilus junonius]|uniref:Uncharacterized protein n=1 Tax=Gymnopilus junonius TaxID=109634 RepID=A0A9P5NB37_GYMJU|nr:hypothetical protein CPB84DRAFT_1852837 [Gymnopilus junonius]
MVNPRAFQGARKIFLTGEKEAYSQAVDEGFVPEAVVKIQHRYFKRFPIDLPDEVDPTPEELAAVDDEAIDPEYPEPDPEKMTGAEYEAAMEELSKRQRKIAFWKGQIKRWLAYQYTKDHDVDSKANGANDPYRALLYKLTGKEFVRPRVKTPCNVWRKTQRGAIEEKTKALAAELSVGKKGLAALRDKIAREMFSQLPEEERRKWRSTAEQESNAAQKMWEQEVTSPASTASEDRQRCILGLIRFMQPVLDLVCEATGWKASFIAGGPEPAHDGKLNMLSIHSGKMTGDVPLDFGVAKREDYKKLFIPIYGRFLKKCYSAEECHSRALKPEDSLSLEAIGLEAEGASLFSVEDFPGGPNPSTSSSQERRMISALEPELSAATPTSVPPTRGASPLAVHPSTLEPPIAPVRLRSRPPSPGPSHACSPPPQFPKTLSTSRSFISFDLDCLHCNGSSAFDPHHLCIGSTAFNEHILASEELLSSPGSPNASPPPNTSFSSISTVSSASEALPSTKTSSASGELLSSSITLSSLWHLLPLIPTAYLKRSGAENEAKGRTTRRSRAAEVVVGSVEPEVPAAVVADSSVPSWFSSVLSMLQSQVLDRDPQWMALVEKWAAFEAQEHYEEVDRLPSSFRPDVIGAWIQQSVLRDTARRQQDQSGQSQRKLGGIEEAGLNGLVSVLAGLFFWGCAAKEGQQTLLEWESAVKDCLVVLTQLTTSVA